MSKAAEYFIIHLGSNKGYAYTYALCELLNFVIVVLNIYLTDVFLGNEFSTYGPEVFRFLSEDPGEYAGGLGIQLIPIFEFFFLN